MHTVWKGSISFGLVNIPVKLFSAVEDKDIKFRQFHKECKSPIKYKKVAECDDDVTSDEIIKVFESPNGRFVQITEEEMNKLKEEHEKKQVAIIDFVKLSEIDPIYFDKTYFVGADSGGSKPYTLLSEILKKSKKIGIAKITIRSKERLAAIRPHQNMLLLETLHFPDEVRNVKDVPLGVTGQAVSEKEFEIGMMLIEQLTTAFDPKKYTDTYRTALEKLIQEKMEKNEYIAASDQPAAEERSNVVDLMSALQASIDRTKNEPAEAPKATKPRKTRAKKTS
ncbi:Ku protein [Bacillus sp. AGMB 02131]|uniref:Non-homologous end joining protein Ku n=1 Tax=Peribacillus faecalis TaxID=2772559 RepID=A0A927CU00_9BACI|nr:Ku protein [Peribacillus faecalis]MBD3107533.1 Ku protein [Peribacillus faecalis]